MNLLASGFYFRKLSVFSKREGKKTPNVDLSKVLMTLSCHLPVDINLNHSSKSPMGFRMPRNITLCHALDLVKTFRTGQLFKSFRKLIVCRNQFLNGPSSEL